MNTQTKKPKKSIFNNATFIIFADSEIEIAEVKRQMELMHKNNAHLSGILIANN